MTKGIEIIRKGATRKEKKGKGERKSESQRALNKRRISATDRDERKGQERNRREKEDKERTYTKSERIETETKERKRKIGRKSESAHAYFPVQGISERRERKRKCVSAPLPFKGSLERTKQSQRDARKRLRNVSLLLFLGHFLTYA